AAADFERALAYRRAIGDESACAIIMAAQGAMMLERGQLADALENLRTAVSSYESRGEKYGLGPSLGDLALVHALQGRPDAAVDCLLRAEENLKSLGDRYHWGLCVLRRAVLASAGIGEGTAEDLRRHTLEVFEPCTIASRRHLQRIAEEGFTERNPDNVDARTLRILAEHLGVLDQWS
ncbi:MAG: tetratricopeptide repeat protein, partial [Myxococcales bacterium]|nr:tetratricopeptide repeat protein [Myxococcales bacterium]